MKPAACSSAPTVRARVARHATRVLAAAAIAAGVLAPGCEGRPGFGKASKDGESLTGPALAELNLSRGVSERGASTLFGAVPGTSHADLVTALRDLDQEETNTTPTGIRSAPPSGATWC
jgi:hypothetical protein